MNKKLFAILLLIAGLAIGYMGASLDIVGGSNNINEAEAKTKAEAFINNNLIPPDSDQKATAEEVSEENGIFKVSINLGGQKIESYITKDGKTFFPQGMEVKENDEDSSQGGDQNSRPSSTVETQKDTPTVELFAMSYCPYGTQMEKAILPVVETLGDSIDFDLQFNDYLMHGEKELDENLRQHCIEQEQASKLTPYLNCFLASEDTENCLDETEVDKGALESCIEETDNEYGLTEKFDDEDAYQNGYPPFDVNKEANEEYSVSGSPTLIVNGETVQPARTPNALLVTICSGFNEKPEACSQELSTSTPSPGFGSGEAASGAAGDCE